MHVIAKRAFEEAMRKYPNERESLSDVYKILKAGAFDTPRDLKNVFPSLDNFKYKEHWYVIDIGGNNRCFIFIVKQHTGRHWTRLMSCSTGRQTTQMIR